MKTENKKAKYNRRNIELRLFGERIYVSRKKKHLIELITLWNKGRIPRKRDLNKEPKRYFLR